MQNRIKSSESVDGWALTMIFSGKTEYAVRSLAELASRKPEGSIMLDDVIAGTGLPRDFVAKIFQELVRAKILASTRGRGGGFALARPAHQITLLSIIDAVEGAGRLDACVVGLERCNDAMPCAQHDLYKPIRQRLKDYLTTTTLADMAASLKQKLSWQKMQHVAPTPIAAGPDPAPSPSPER